jgi:photosystem II stability/assembly factor-like uncharacterized protein
MRYLKFVLIPAVLFLLPGIGQADWFWQNPSPQGNPLFSVHFIDDNTGYVAGFARTILKTTNGGTNWDTLSSGTNSDLHSIHFPVNAQTGYAVGGSANSSTILKTTDGGTNWVSQSSGTTIILLSVHFPVDAQTGYVAGEGGTILKTSDGGTNWVGQNSGTIYYLRTVQFPVDAQTGYTVGMSGTILKTTDGGTWVEEARNAEFGMRNAELRINPNPFTSFTTVSGHSSDRFALYDVSGRRVGTYRGDRIGEGLRAGVYFIRPDSGNGKPVRVVKVR